MVSPADVPTISESFLARMYAHARETFPEECCGYILGKGAQAELAPCVNRQNRLHELDPEAHPRTAANGYNIGGKELLTLVRSFESDKPATIIYHSHPKVGAYFSDEDANAAHAAGFEVDYLVIDAQADEIVEAVLFRRDPDADAPRYLEIARFAGAQL